MNRTRRTFLAAATAVGGTLAAVSFWRGAKAPAEAVPGARVVEGASPPPVTVAAVRDSADLTAWKSMVNQKMVLSGAGQTYQTYVADVLAQPARMAERVTVAQAHPRRSFWGSVLGTSKQNSSAALPASSAATLPAGIRPQSFAVRFEVHSLPAPTTDMLLDLDRAVVGLKRVFVQPATAWNDKPMVVAIFG